MRFEVHLRRRRVCEGSVRPKAEGSADTRRPLLAQLDAFATPGVRPVLLLARTWRPARVPDRCCPDGDAPVARICADIVAAPRQERQRRWRAPADARLLVRECGSTTVCRVWSIAWNDSCERCKHPMPGFGDYQVSAAHVVEGRTACS
jgi:hypothetical protein